MSALDLLTPINEQTIYLKPGSIGEKINFLTDEFKNKGIAIFGCPDLRGGGIDKYSNINLIREEFYKLAWGNWDISIYDLGDIIPGDTLDDTHFAIQEIVRELITYGLYPIVLGGGMDLAFSLYRGLDILEIPLNYTAIDSDIQLDTSGIELTENNYISKIITEEPNLLFHFANIGYQSYFVSQEVVNILESMNFEYYRLGEITADIKEVEPILRGTDIIGINLNSIESSSDGNIALKSGPNGFSNREICAIGRYIGLTEQIKITGIFNFFGSSHNKMPQKLVSQLLWYIIEGKNKKKLYQDEDYVKYTILQEDKELVFLKDKKVDRWWISIDLENKGYSKILVPCSFRDYKEALEGHLPERYWKTFKRFL